jgi:putative ABC transport system ATP-binding protein
MRFGFTVKGVAADWAGSEVGEYDDIEVDLDACGRLLPIYGKTGIGKSTLMFLLAAMKHRRKGALVWSLPGVPSCPLDGDLNDIRRRWFGLMYQDGRMLPHLTVADNLSYPLRLRGMRAGDALDKARETLTGFLIGDEAVDVFLARHPDELSGGQKRRVAIAKGVIWDPVVFFADEPSSGLDDSSRWEVMQALSRWATAPGTDRALVWVTHETKDVDVTGARKRLDLVRRDDNVIGLDLRCTNSAKVTELCS